MAKNFLNGYTREKDIIDSVSDENFLNTSEGKPETAAGKNSNEVPDNAEEKDVFKKMEIRREGFFTVFETDGVSYRIGGLKPLFVTNLRVNIRAGNGKVSYYDTIDLYQSRGRTNYAQGVFRTWGMNPERCENDLVKILEYLEKERDERLMKKTSPLLNEMSEEERSLGMNLLCDRNIFRRITDDMTRMGYVGEELNKVLMYLCASSRKLDDPISVLILSQSASGKSYLVDTVKKLMPPEDVISVTSLSDQALNYIDSLMHKFLILGEAVHSDTIEYQIREMLSGKELSRLVTVKDPETGKMHSEIVRTPAVVSSVMSGTSTNINPE
ncbi:MAG: hypothetical protein HUK25_00780, partial [Treponema sp.]|nr:hypothetical protein [Treponema sp.]